MKQWQNYSISYILILIGISLFSCKEPDKVIEIDKEQFAIEDHIIIGETMTTQIANMPDIFNI